MSSFPSLLTNTVLLFLYSSGSITSTTALLLHTQSSIPTRPTTVNQRNYHFFHSPNPTISIHHTTTHYQSSTSDHEPSPNNHTTTHHQQLLHNFLTDIQNLQTLRPPIPSSDCSVPPSIVSAGSSYTRLWRFSTWESHQTPPLRRYFRHVGCWRKSSTARRIFPAVVASSLYSLVMAFVLRHVTVGRYHFGSLTQGASAAMASLTAPLALLLTFRTNASLGRLLEARLFWGRLVLHARSLAGLLVSVAYHTDSGKVVLACRYLSILGWCTKAAVRNEPFDSEEKMIRTVLDGEEADWLLSQPKRTVGITIRLRNLLSNIVVTDGPHFLAQHQLMESIVCDIEADFGGCERLLNSPIPPTYSRHLSRIMVIYLGLLPFGLVASGIPSLGTAVASGVISYMLIGIDEIGLEIENPFPLLPLQQLAGVVQKDVVSQLVCRESMPR